MLQLRRLSAILAALALFAIGASAQSWSLLSPSGTAPAARGFQGTTGVYDPASNRMIVFGGRDTNGNNLNDVWVLTNANGLGGASQWINLIANGDSASPPARSGHSAAYDTANNRMIIFGGCSGSCAPALNDVWVLSNANGLGGAPAWSQLSIGSAPAARTNAAAAYDQTRNQLILFGGQDGSANPCSTFSDVWVLGNANGLGGSPVWMSPQIINGVQLPSGQNAASAVYDAVRGVMTIFGGTGMVNGVCTVSNAAWQLSSNQPGELASLAIWNNITPEGAPGSPSARSFAAGIYDGTGGRMLLFGGADGSGNYLNDVWALSNATGLGSPQWAMLNPTGGPPSARSSQAASFDSSNQRMTIFAGSGASGVLNDSWVLASPGISGLSCSAIAGNPNIVRSAGIAERVGDLVLNCTGGTPTLQGQPIPQYTLQLTLNTNITSRALPEAANLSEALLDIDEPFPASPEPSFAVPVPGAPSQILCTPLGAACLETGTGGAPSPYQTQPNIFAGTQISANSLSWNIPIDPPGVNATRIIRLSNVRANASALGAGSTLSPTMIQATVGIQGSPAVPIASPQQAVAIGQPGTVVTVNASSPISQCVPHNAALFGGSGTAAFDFSTQVQESFLADFKFRNYGTILSGPIFPPQLAEQNVFGFVYSTESGFYSPNLFTTAPTLGLADSGTRIRVEFQGVGSGTHLFVPITVNTQALNCNPLDPSCNLGELQLVQADQNGSSPAGYEPVLATETIGTTPVAEANYSGSFAYAIYEVIKSSPNLVEHAAIPVAVAFSGAIPPAGSVTVETSLAPLSSVTAADPSAPLPRFVDAGTPQPAYAINSCPCTYSLTPSSASIAASGGSGSFAVTTSQQCPIQPASQATFVSITVAGSVVDYWVAPNPLPYPRTALVVVGGQTFTLLQAAATLTFTPSQLKFTSGPVTAPPAQAVNVSGWQGSFIVSVNVPWATVTPSSQQLPATLTVAVSPVGLQPGNYGATITVNVNGSLATYFFQYEVMALPSLVAVPAQLTFSYSGGAPPPSQQLEIYSTSPVVFQASGSGFVSVTPGSGTTTQEVTVSVDPSTLGPGAHSGSVTVTASGVTNSPLVIPITLNVVSTGPQFTSASVVNAASFQGGPLAPGSLFTIFGANLAHSQASTKGLELQTSLDGVSMSIAGISVPLQFVSPGQINAQVPYEVAPGQQPLVVTSNGMSTQLQVTILPSAPGIFLVNGRGAILNQDSSLNSQQNPAVSGSVVQVFFTGQGSVSQPVVSGSPASLTTLSYTSATTTATVGNEAATVTFSGLAPGLIGVGQANVQVPSLPTSDYPLVLTVNGVSSNSVTMAVKTP